MTDCTSGHDQSGRPTARSARCFAKQTFWVFVAAVHRRLRICRLPRRHLRHRQNLFNVTRNFAFVAIIALGMTAVIISGGIDLSVGSILCLVGMVVGMTMNCELFALGRRALRYRGCACVGIFNGFLIA